MSCHRSVVAYPAKAAAEALGLTAGNSNRRHCPNAEVNRQGIRLARVGQYPGLISILAFMRAFLEMVNRRIARRPHRSSIRQWLHAYLAPPVPMTSWCEQLQIARCICVSTVSTVVQDSIDDHRPRRY